jgi:hypothetical protein
MAILASMGILGFRYVYELDSRLPYQRYFYTVGGMMKKHKKIIRDILVRVELPCTLTKKMHDEYMKQIKRIILGVNEMLDSDNVKIKSAKELRG